MPTRWVSTPCSARACSSRRPRRSTSPVSTSWRSERSSRLPLGSFHGVGATPGPRSMVSCSGGPPASSSSALAAASIHAGAAGTSAATITPAPVAAAVPAPPAGFSHSGVRSSSTTLAVSPASLDGDAVSLNGSLWAGLPVSSPPVTMTGAGAAVGAPVPAAPVPSGPPGPSRVSAPSTGASSPRVNRACHPRAHNRPMGRSTRMASSPTSCRLRFVTTTPPMTATATRTSDAAQIPSNPVSGAVSSAPT